GRLLRVVELFRVFWVFGVVRLVGCREHGWFWFWHDVEAGGLVVEAGRQLVVHTLLTRPGPLSPTRPYAVRRRPLAS
ncbi:MAG TPA: hypothetical protein VFL38_15990, partial [Humibacillus xanthopallidus]|nr:hypothetical protein [Humibacillus xanthopallidus]